MLHRAVDYKTAQEVCVAVELARKGAGALVLERVTGFGSRWCRELVRDHGGPIARRLRDPHRWFEEDPQRLLHGTYVVMAYECQRVNRSPGRRLLGAYEYYRRITRQPGLLDVNECAQIIDLYQKGNAWIRPCKGCPLSHLVLYERPLCPVCRFLSKSLCRRCKEPLEDVPPGTAYCNTCVEQLPNLAARRRREQRKRAHKDLYVAGVQPASICVPALIATPAAAVSVRVPEESPCPPRLSAELPVAAPRGMAASQ